VLVLDPNLTATLPVIFNELALLPSTLSCADPLAGRKRMLIDSRSWRSPGRTDSAERVTLGKQQCL